MTLDLVTEPARLEKPMDHVAHWTVDLFVAEHEDSVSVRAELSTPGGPIRGRGEARLTSGPLRQPEVADTLAAARALSDLAGHLTALSRDDGVAVRDHARTQRWRYADLLAAGTESPLL